MDQLKFLELGLYIHEVMCYNHALKQVVIV